MSLGKATFIHEESLEEDKNTPFQKRNFSKWIFLKETIAPIGKWD